MIGSVAVLSDIHGVMPALDAVLAEPGLQGADLIVLTGDIAAGPQPTEVLDRLLGLGDKVVWVRGNADRDLVELARDMVDDVGDAIASWAAKQLSPDHVDWLAGLPYPVTLTVEGFGEVVFCHATPRDDQEVVVVDSRLERWAEVLGDLPPEVMTVVCGHTHMPFMRLANTRQVINPGSVGMPYGRQGAHWAILSGGAVELHRTAYDPVAACAQVTASSSYPDVAQWTDYFLHARATDVDARALLELPGVAPGAVAEGFGDLVLRRDRADLVSQFDPVDVPGRRDGDHRDGPDPAPRYCPGHPPGVTATGARPGARRPRARP